VSVATCDNSLPSQAVLHVELLVAIEALGALSLTYFYPCWR